VSAIKVFHSCPRGLQPFNIYESSNIFENLFFAMFCFIQNYIHESIILMFDKFDKEERKFGDFPKRFQIFLMRLFEEADKGKSPASKI